LTRSGSLFFAGSEAHNPGVLTTETLDRITVDPARLNGQPCIRDLRISVRRVLEALSTYPERAEVLREYPELEEEDLRQVLAYAALAVEDRVIDFPFPRAS
jgi:uncharacterized protein (DUF433 family)